MIPRHLLIGVVVLLVAVLGMSIYAWHMRGRVAAIPGQPAADTRALVPDFFRPHRTGHVCSSPSTKMAACARGRANSSAQRTPAARRRIAAAPCSRIYLDKTSPHTLGPGADVRSVFLVDPGVAVIDLNSAFADGHRSGVLVEDLTITSLIHTLSANIPGI
jgi:hypothetical protein